MSTTWKCPDCGSWIGSMQVHEDCARKMEEASQVPRPMTPERIHEILRKAAPGANALHRKL